MGFFKDLFDAIFSRKKEKTFNEHNKNHQSCDFRIIKFNEHKRPEGYGRDNANSHKIDDLTFEVEVEEVPGGSGRGRYKPPKVTTTTSTTTTTTATPTSTTTTTTVFGDTTTTTTTQAPTTSTTTSTTRAPSSTAGVILLDFDGAVVRGTSWNYAGDITAGPANLTEAEQLVILNNTIEDYAQFNVIVTRDVSVYNAAPATKRTWCIITETNEWYGSNAGGVAFVGSMTTGAGTPCWIFSKLLGYNTKYIQEAVSHEVGHTIGLRHQAVWDANCVLINSYNQGANGEAPIMGVGYYQPDVHWWIGPTSEGCRTIQDDVKIITSVLGLR